MWKDVSLKIREAKGGNKHYVCFQFCWYLGFEITSKNREQQGIEALKQRIEAPIHACIWISTKLHAKSLIYFIVFYDKKAKNLYSISFLDYRILLICIAMAQDRVKGIH